MAELLSPAGDMERLKSSVLFGADAVYLGGNSFGMRTAPKNFGDDLREAVEYAHAHGLSCVEFLPDYAKYGRSAPLRRNLQIIEYADMVLAFWDGKSRGTAYVIRKCREMNVPCKVFMRKNECDNEV